MHTKIPLGLFDEVVRCCAQNRNGRVGEGKNYLPCFLCHFADIWLEKNNNIVREVKRSCEVSEET